MDTSRLATETLQTLAGRFDGVDLQYRAEGWGFAVSPYLGQYPVTWRATIVTNKNQDADFRITAYGLTALEATASLTGMITAIENHRKAERDAEREAQRFSAALVTTTEQ